ncbi:50S ribosomal protein L25/general stress protein Ctc [Kocuria rhizophila]|uniref:Large ribosomal subunit protein bL25 n=1 Tax=Kocuria rhizophila (strain ATCC 9341 / DSM 348 / NBRC 103217 / DC2201) TaxID=378753 RepID=RL25_KOCRD|nr:50S ribosomal protein L25/general stress protein Ctc [Kocuria rhizophila]B2GLJ3.1 RecName: Full=Large ribosomal subunit protein bL25; AltName: Full=50S ribosomal protein L25; AltName: Full=General stress protein CTC [Kocuria rhizophila DC2201]ASE12141.1 50S ribosomal protein L25 [Kocuria rhizophila]BAG30067.1 50S ribosomal protein L25 [Kocuria rhizophila DC2201]VEH74663.1 General stress protein CTC [Kocuria rhizophila]
MVDVITIPATLRTEFGKGYARRVRANDKIPAVIYGHGAEPLHVILPGHEMMLASRNSNAVLDINVDGEGHLAMIKEVQRHAVRPEILHIDLLTVRRGERVEVEIPVHVEGEVAPTAIHNVEENVLVVEADALKVPEYLTVDITDLEVGEHVYAKDVTLPGNVTLVSDPELLVVNVSEPVEQDLGEESETEEEGAEGEKPAESTGEEPGDDE